MSLFEDLSDAAGHVGALLADDMGLGKSLLVFAVRRHLIKLRRDALRSPDEHMPLNHPPGTWCSNREVKHDLLQYACERGGRACRIAKKHTDLPAIVFMPARLTDGRVKQVSIDTPKKSMAFSTRILHLAVPYRGRLQ